MKNTKVLSYIFQIAQIIMTLILSVLSILLSKEVWEKYTLQSTSFSKSDVPITPSDTASIIFGFWPLKNTNYSKDVPYQLYEQMELGKDFNITYGIIEYKTIIESIELTENQPHLKINHKQMSEVKFEKLTTKFGFYYRIQSDITRVKTPNDTFFHLSISENTRDEELPDVEVAIQSGISSNGATMWDWKDGDKLTVAKVRGYNKIRLKPERVNNLKIGNTCQDKAYYQCFEERLLEEDFSDCPRKCLSISTISNFLPLCKTEEEFRCAHEIAKRVKGNQTNCLQPCSKTHFKLHRSLYNEETPDGKRNIIFAYQIPDQNIVVEHEYLIHDFTSMLGSIGGTLGMFIGFSFLGTLSTFLSWLQRLMEYIFSRKAITESRNIVHVKEANENPPKNCKFGCGFNEEEYVKRSELKKLEDKVNQILQSIEELS